MSGFVYAIEAADGLIKFGFTTDLRRRLQAFQTAHHSPLRLLGFVTATQEQERELHRLLLPFRERGEWYRPSKAVLRAVQMMRPWASHPRANGAVLVRRYPDSPLAIWLAETRTSTRRAGELFGIAQPTVSRLIAGTMMPSLAVALRIEAATKGAVPMAALLPRSR